MYKSIFQKIFIIAGVMTLLSLSGCVNGSQQLSDMTTQTVYETFKPGKTTKTYVRETLGEPQQISIHSNSIVWHYRYQTVTANFFIPFVNIVDKDAEHHGSLYIKFDDNQLIEELGYHASK